MENQNIRIRLRGFDSSLLDSSTLDIIDPTPQTVDALMKLDLSAGVEVDIKI